jgi:hypothetical protein
MQWYKLIISNQRYLNNEDKILSEMFNSSVEIFNGNDFTDVLLCCQFDIKGNMIYYIYCDNLSKMEKLLSANNYNFLPCEQPKVIDRPTKYDYLRFLSGDKKLWEKVLHDSGMSDE